MLNNSPLTDSLLSSTPSNSNVDNLSTGEKEEKKQAFGVNQVFGVYKDSLDAHGALTAYPIKTGFCYFSAGMRAVVERASGLPWAHILSKRRYYDLVGARSGVALYLRLDHPANWSFDAIGLVVNRDHTTMMFAVNKYPNYDLKTLGVAEAVREALQDFEALHGIADLEAAE